MKNTEPEYLNSNKNVWRVDKWSAIKRFVEKNRRVKDTLVLYLAGPDDLDRRVACQLGFRTSNLIAVNGNKAICEAIRRRGFPTMHGRFERIVASIPDDVDVGVIDADFCAGLDNTVARLLDESFLQLLGRELVLSFNLQRGRDAASNEARKAFNEEYASAANDELLDPNLKHRGQILWQGMHGFLGQMCNIRNAAEHPWLASYKSNRVVMDSVVFPWNFLPNGDLAPEVQNGLEKRKRVYPRERKLWIARKAVMARQGKMLH